MDLSERNHKVAISRWNKIHQQETRQFRRDEMALEKKAFILGCLAGDGSVQKRKVKSVYRYQLDFYPDDELLKDTYVKYFKFIYNKTPSTRYKNNVYYVRITSKTVTEDIMEFAFGLIKWRAPLAFLDTASKRSSWLKGFFSAEGYVGTDAIKVQTVNQKGMDDVSFLLHQCNIQHKTYSYLPKKKNHSKVYIIMILRKEERLKFYRKINFFHFKKSEALRKSLCL